MTRVAARSAGALTAEGPRRGRLTDVERAERALLEGDFQRQVTDLATMLGWEWVHWRHSAVPTMRGGRRVYIVPTSGPLGTGWPDLTLVRQRDRRLIFAELKRELEDLRPEQERVLAVLRNLGWWPVERDAAAPLNGPAIEVYIWRPSDLRDPVESSVIGRILR